MDKLALIEAANEWLDHQERRRGLAHHTVETYASAIRCFIKCLPSDYGDGDVDQAICRRMTKASASTRKRTWDAMSLFCRWWEGTGGPPSPFADMVPPESSDAMRRPMSEIELRILVGALTETAAGPRPDGRRDVAIILCLLEAGFRIGDCTYLRVSDLDFAAKRVRCRHGKGSTDKWLDMSGWMAEAIQLWLEESGIDGGYVFPGRYGQASTEMIRLAWGRVVQDRLPGCVPHMCRNSLASELHRLGLDVTEIQKVMRHKKITTTMRYIECDDVAKRAALVRFDGRLRALAHV